MHRRLQFDKRENPASDRRYDSRSAVAMKAPSNITEKEGPSTATCTTVVLGCFGGAFKTAIWIFSFLNSRLFRLRNWSDYISACARQKHGHRCQVTGGSDLENFLGGLKPEKWGSIKGDVKKKHFPFRKGEERFSDIELPPKIASCARQYFGRHRRNVSHHLAGRYRRALGHFKAA